MNKVIKNSIFAFVSTVLVLTPFTMEANNECRSYWGDEYYACLNGEVSHNDNYGNNSSENNLSGLPYWDLNEYLNGKSTVINVSNDNDYTYSPDNSYHDNSVYAPQYSTPPSYTQVTEYTDMYTWQDYYTQTGGAGAYGGYYGTDFGYNPYIDPYGGGFYNPQGGVYYNGQSNDGRHGWGVGLTWSDIGNFFGGIFGGGRNRNYNDRYAGDWYGGGYNDYGSGSGYYDNSQYYNNQYGGNVIDDSNMSGGYYDNTNYWNNRYGN